MNRITSEKLKEFLRYEAESGLFFWIDANRGIEPAGRVLNGYLRISLPGFGVEYAHRLAWLYVTGSFPPGFIDHADCNRANNAWANLREATPSQNSANSRTPKNNTTGKKGVTRYLGKFRAQISVDGSRRWLGDFPTLEEAASAYERAATEAFGQFARAA